MLLFKVHVLPTQGDAHQDPIKILNYKQPFINLNKQSLNRQQVNVQK